MRRAIVLVSSATLALLLLTAAVVSIAAATGLSARDVRLWFGAVGGVLSAAAAIVVAMLGFHAQRVQALEAADEQRRQARESAEDARRMAREHFEQQLELEERRTRLNMAMAEEASATLERRRGYGELLGWAYKRLSRDEDAFESGREYGEALATASEQVRAALETFMHASGGAKLPAYNELLRVVRSELGSDEVVGREAE